MSLLSRLFGRSAGSGAPAATGPAPLGEGLWRQAHDRFTRAVDRFYEASLAMHESQPGIPASELLARQTHRLGALADRVRELCAEAQDRYPASGPTLSGTAARAIPDVPRLLSRAATQIATAAQAATMARTGREDPLGAARAAVRYIDSAAECIGEADRMLRRDGG